MGNRYSQFKEELALVEELLVSRRVKRDSISDALKRIIARLAKVNQKSQDLADTVMMVQKFSEGIQTGVVQRFEDLLTKGVRQIYGNQNSIRIQFEAKANTIQADFVVVLPDGKEISLSKGEGGGLRDLVSVLQRILYIVLEPSRPERIIFFDENLKHLDSKRALEGFRFITQILKELDIQVIWITHSDAARAISGEGIRLLEVGNDGNNSIVRQVTLDA